MHKSFAMVVSAVAWLLTLHITAQEHSLKGDSASPARDPIREAYEANAPTPALVFPSLEALPLLDRVDPLVCLDGTPVKTREDWEKKRRPEIIALAQHYIYGSCPPERLLDGTPPSYVVEEDKESLAEQGAVRKLMAVPLAPNNTNAVMHFQLVVPAGGKAPYPTLVVIGRDPLKKGEKLIEWDHAFVRRGYALAGISLRSGTAASYTYYFPEHSGPWVQGEPYTGGDKRLLHGWGTIAVWAWRARRMIDVLRTLPEVDPDRIVVCGGSRTGMSAVLSAAIDKRIAMVICGEGIHEWRPLDASKYGVTATGKPHTLDWFAPMLRGFQKQDRLGALPVGSYCVLAAVAPRPALVTTTEFFNTCICPSTDSYNAIEHVLPVYRFLGEDVGMPANVERAGVGLHGRGPLRLFLTTTTGGNAGHGGPPTPVQMNAMIDFVDEYLKPNPSKPGIRGDTP
jgi:hypothetical protein